MTHEYRAKGAPPPQPERSQPDPNGPHPYRYALHGVPVTAPGGHVPFQMPEEFADDIGRHLKALSFWTRDELVAMADADGMLNVAALPGPSLRQDPPLAGPSGWLNPGPWVPISSPPPAAPMDVVPIDPESLSDAEADALRIEKEAMEEVLRRREIIKARRAEADPDLRGPQ